MAAPERRLQLLDLAEDLFTERGFASVTMEDIARAGGVTRPVVYGALGSREEAYLACVRRARDTYAASMLSAVDLAARPREQLRAGGSAFFSILEQQPRKWRLLFGGDAVLPVDQTRELAALRFETIEAIRALLAPWMSDASEDRVSACAHVVSGAGERLGHWWLTRPDLTRADVVEHFVEICWAGLAPFVIV